MDGEPLVAIGNRLGNLFRLQHDIISRAGLVAFDLVLGVDQPAGFGVDKFAMDPMPGFAIEDVKGIRSDVDAAVKGRPDK